MATRIAYPKQKLVDIGLDGFHHLDREPIYGRTAYPRHHLLPPPPINYYPQNKPYYPTYQKPKFVEPQEPKTMFFTTYQPPRAYAVHLNPETGKEEVISTSAFREFDQPHYNDYPRKSTPSMAPTAAYI
nr:hypothetical protein Itr_chr13CG04140 [Ipomoea trifida]